MNIAKVLSLFLECFTLGDPFVTYADSHATVIVDANKAGSVEVKATLYFHFETFATMAACVQAAAE